VLLEHRQKLLYHLLPDLDPDHLYTDPNAYRVVTYVRQVDDEMRLTMQSTSDQAESAREQTTPSQYFTDIGCSRLMILCGINSEDDLPGVWCMVPKFGKKDYTAVTLSLKQTPHNAGMAIAPPMATPEFVKRLLFLLFAGNDMDNLSKGMHPFALVFVDHHSQQTPASIKCGQNEATNYDLATSGEATTRLADARVLCGPARVNVQFDNTRDEAKLESMILVLHMMMGFNFPLIINAHTFIQRHRVDRL
jgi:hypothetical protein